MSGGQENALQAAKALQVPIPLIHQWQDFRRMALGVPSTSSRPLRQGTTEAVEAIIGHGFRLPHLLAQALVNGLILKKPFACMLTRKFQTHASVDGYDATCYERLEFLGDAILDFRTSPLVVNFWHQTDMASDGTIHILSRGSFVTGCDDNAEGRPGLLT